MMVPPWNQTEMLNNKKIFINLGKIMSAVKHLQLGINLRYELQDILSAQTLKLYI